MSDSLSKVLTLGSTDTPSSLIDFHGNERHALSLPETATKLA